MGLITKGGLREEGLSFGGEGQILGGSGSMELKRELRIIVYRIWGIEEREMLFHFIYSCRLAFLASTCYLMNGTA